MKRVTSIIMVLAMLVSLIPVNVSAEGLQEEPSQEVVRQEQSEQQSEEALEADSQGQTPEEEPEEGSQEPLPEEDLEEESQVSEKEPEVPAILTWEEYCYTLLADGSVSICGFEGAPENEEEPFLVEIPSEINGSKVAEIAEKAFAGNGEIEGVLLPETIQTIGSGAFEDCKNLRAIAFLGTEPAFGETLAKNAEKLQKILTLDGFDFCNLEYILAQDFGEETIGSICFQTFDTHESVINAFEGSMEDTQITAEVDDEVISGTSIGTPSTEEISTLPEDVITASGKCGNNLTWTLFQDGTMVISGSGAMWHGYGTTEYDAYKEQIENIVFEDGVNAIGGYAFAYCANLETVKFPDTVTTIGSDAFLGCSGLKELAIPDSVTSAGGSAFSGCTSLTDLSIGRGLTEIAYNLFSGCTSLTTVVIPDSVTYIGQSAFESCSSLKNVMIPTSVTAIGHSTAQGSSFASCLSLEEIYIPDSVTDIGVKTFWNCTNLKKVRLPSQLKDIQISLFSRCSSLETIEIPDGVEHIGLYAFKGCTNLKEINLPDSVVSIGGQAFYDCSSLTNIVIPKKCNLAGSGGWDYIFNGCTSLTTVTIPVGVTLICTGAFNLCPSITDVYYEGSETQWNEIIIESRNEDLTNATIHFYGSVAEGSFQNHQYSVHDLSMTWEEAKEFCENLGGHLVTVTSAGEQAFLESLLPDPCTKRQYWLGASLENGAWRWVTGETFEYTNWDINRPDHQNGGEFAEIFNCSGDDGAYPATRYKWNDITYNNVSGNNPVVGADAIGFICEYDSLVPGDVRYFSSWDAENQIAYFGPGDMLGSQVTEETDVSFTENPTALLGQYVLVETKPRTDGDIGPDMLISVKAVETKTGTVTTADAVSVTIDSKTYATPTSMTQPESYVDQFVLYHLYDGNLAEVEILETIEGTLISWDEQTRLLNVNLDGAAKNPVVYTLSPLADADTVSRLNSGSLINSNIRYIKDCSGLVYRIEGIHELDTWSFSNSTSAFGPASQGYYITRNDYSKLLNGVMKVTEREAIDNLLNVGGVEGILDIYPLSNLRHASWGGSCYGMSSWVTLKNNGILQASDIDGKTTSLNAYSCSNPVESAINFYHAQQYLANSQGAAVQFMSLPNQKDQLTVLESMGKKANETGDNFLISYSWYRLFNEDGTCNTEDEESYCGHAVVGYGWEKIEPTEFDDSVVDVNGVTFNYRILVYDCAYPDQRDGERNIYYNDDGIWYIPGYHIVSRDNHTADTNHNNGWLKRVTDDENVINTVDYNNGRFAVSVSNTMLTTSAGTDYTIEWADKSAEISGFTVTSAADEKIYVVLADNYTADGTKTSTIKTAILPESAKYSIRSKEDMGFVFKNDSCYIMAGMNASGFMTFGADGMISIAADEATEYYLDMVSNEGYCDLPWFKAEIFGTGITRLSTEESVEGIIIYSDNLNDVTIRVSDDISTNEITISSDKNAILLTQKENEPAVYEDTDDDGTFEKEITDSEEIRVSVAGMGLHVSDEVWIDGVEYSVKSDGSGLYVELPDANARIMVTYSYNIPDATDVHTKYPTGMKVWTLEQENGTYSATYVSELDNLLQYSGSSIRVTGNKGIRMITSINQDTRNKLMGNGLAGFNLLEYGTLLAQTSKLGDDPLVLGGANVKSNYAYKKGVADPVFKYTDGLIQYTNVLVGFTEENCKDDIAMRPYIKLKDASGDVITIYGGIVQRSIGYIAWQNRDTFAIGSDGYNYIWEIINAVYKNGYPAD